VLWVVQTQEISQLINSIRLILQHLHIQLTDKIELIDKEQWEE
jgi:hypothetical protein